MCYFNSAPIRKVLHLEKGEAIEAYKMLSVRHDGMLASPYQKKRWARLRHTSIVEPDLDLVRKRYPTVGSLHKVYGIYCMRSKSTAPKASQGNVVVKVKIWGKVIVCGALSHDIYGKTYAGYLAEHAEVVEIVGPRPFRVIPYLGNVKKRYPKLEVSNA